jgi:hypothetical protein
MTAMDADGVLLRYLANTPADMAQSGSGSNLSLRSTAGIHRRIR